MATLKKEFTSADLDANFKLVYYHGTGSIEYAPLLYDNTNTQRTTTDIFSFVDNNTIALELGNTIIGTWTLYLQGLTDVGGGTVRKLHDLDLDASPTNDLRLAIGKLGTATKNITLDAFYTLLDSVLNFTERDGNNITHEDDWRAKLDIYSTTDVDDAIKANALVPDVRGQYTLGDVGTVYSTYTVTFTDLGTTDYQVIATMTDADTTPVLMSCVWKIYDKQASSFKIAAVDEATGGTTNFVLDYMIFKN